MNCINKNIINNEVEENLFIRWIIILIKNEQERFLHILLLKNIKYKINIT